jgi:putative redox protein
VTVALDWVGEGLIFTGGAAGGPAIRVDGNGGQGPSPVQMLLLSLAGCAAADVVDILKKGRTTFEGLTVRLEGERVADPPRRFTAIRMVFETRGLAATDETKLRRAITLSMEKYCSVLHTLKQDIEFSTETVLS